MSESNSLKVRSFAFALGIMRPTEHFPRKRSAWIIEDQLIRSATSIGANLHEAKSASSRLEFKKFQEIALKSANETVYWLELLGESSLISKDSTLNLLDEAEQLSRMIASGVIRLKASL